MKPNSLSGDTPSSPALPAKALPAGPHNPHVPEHLNDTHWGQGGRFVIDPASGERLPVADDESVGDDNTSTTSTSAPKKGK